MLIADNYKLEKLIGNGSFGKVYKAKSKSNGNYVAVKLVILLLNIGRKRYTLTTIKT